MGASADARRRWPRRWRGGRRRPGLRRRRAGRRAWRCGDSSSTCSASLARTARRRGWRPGAADAAAAGHSARGARPADGEAAPPRRPPGPKGRGRGGGGATLGALLVGHTLLAMGGHEGGPRAARLPPRCRSAAAGARGPEYLAGHGLPPPATSPRRARSSRARPRAPPPPPPPAHPLLGNLLAARALVQRAQRQPRPASRAVCSTPSSGAPCWHARMGPLAALRLRCRAARRHRYESGGGDDDAAQRGRTLLDYALRRRPRGRHGRRSGARRRRGGGGARRRGGGRGPGTARSGRRLSTQAHRILSREVPPQSSPNPDH